MSSIQIFDCLTHPTMDGNWILPGYPQKSTIDVLLAEMDAENICGAFAVGMNGMGSYNESLYSEFVLSKTDKLLPIAFFNINEHHDIISIIAKIKYLKSKKYRGIKLHPRIGNFSLLHHLLPGIIKAANDENLAVLLCTYFYENNENSVSNNIENLLKLLLKIPNEKIIFLHSGSVRLLELMEIARVFNNVLLDLSFTLLKYKGSSLELDIHFLFNDFDRRICIGSDYPQYSITDLRNRFNYFAENIDIDKASNIAYKNLLKFLKF